MSLRNQLIRTASKLPANSDERKQVLALLGDKTAKAPVWTLKEKGSAVKLHGTFTLRGQDLKITMVNQWSPDLDDPKKTKWEDMIRVTKVDAALTDPDVTSTQKRKAIEFVKAEMIKRYGKA